MMTQTLLSAARRTRQGEKLPMLMQMCAASRHAVAGRIQWHRHSCSPRGTKGLCAFAKPTTQRVAHRVTSHPSQLLIANLELKLHSTHRKTSPLKISNRKYSSIFRRSDQDRRPERTQRAEARFLHAFLIHGSAIKTPANLHRFNYMQISNRRQTGGKPTILFALELSELLVECAPVRTLLLTILFVSPAAAQSWTVETTGWDSNLRAVTAIHSSNPQRHPAPVIWASGSNGRTLRSTDGGQHYTRGLVNAVQAHSLDLRGIQAFNEKLAYVMASGPGNMSRIYKTRNGGETWKLQFSGSGKQF